MFKDTGFRQVPYEATTIFFGGSLEKCLLSSTMIGFVKRILFRLLPERLYLRTLHRGFYLLYDLGLLKRDKRFKFHYYIKKLIQPDAVVIDIGANLGYFSRNFARLTPRGKLISIEPIKPFYEVLVHFLNRYPQVEIINGALGTEHGTLTMVLPENKGVIRTGLPHIAKDENEKMRHRTQEVTVYRGSEIFATLDRIDYIKCDIEGYERIVFEEIRPILAKHKPIVQIEIAPENRESMFTYFEALGYEQHGIADNQLIKEHRIQKEQGDYLFIHPKS